MAIVYYQELKDDNGDLYTFNPNSQYANMFANWYDGYVAGNYTSFAGDISFPFKRNAGASSSFDSYTKTFTYNGNTLALTFNSQCYLEVRLNNTYKTTILLKYANFGTALVSSWLALNDETNQVCINGMYCGDNYGSQTYLVTTGYIFNANDSEIVKSILDNSAPITYQWQSVPSISGKNGILTLSTLNDINDGEAITTSDTTKFNRSANANVGNVISEIINT